MTDDQILDAILEREGGWSDRPTDRGGPTNMGITLATLCEYRDRVCTPSDLRALKRDEARSIYRDRYILLPGLHLVLDDKLRGLAVDMAVNHGPHAALRMLQRAVGATDDGVMGPHTLEAIQAAGPAKAYAHLCAERARHFGLCLSDPSQSIFARGWMNRLASFIEDAA